MFGNPLDNGKEKGAAETTVERHEAPIRADAIVESIMSSDYVLLSKDCV